MHSKIKPSGNNSHLDVFRAKSAQVEPAWPSGETKSYFRARLGNGSSPDLVGLQCPWFFNTSYTGRCGLMEGYMCSTATTEPMWAVQLFFHRAASPLGGSTSKIGKLVAQHTGDTDIEGSKWCAGLCFSTTMPRIPQATAWQILYGCSDLIDLFNDNVSRGDETNWGSI